MPVASVTIHPRGLNPLQAAKAWYLHKEEGLPLPAVRLEVTNALGCTPSVKAVWTAVHAAERSHGGDGVPRTRYANCRRRSKLGDKEQKAIVAFVKAWRNKRFCTCAYMKVINAVELVFADFFCIPPIFC